MKCLHPSENSLVRGERGGDLEVLEMKTKLGLSRKKEGLSPQKWKWSPGLFSSFMPDPSRNAGFIWTLGARFPRRVLKGCSAVARGVSFFKEICPWKMSSWAHVLGLQPGPLFSCLYVSQVKTQVLSSHLNNSAIFREAETMLASVSWKNALIPTSHNFTHRIIPRNVENRFRIPRARGPEYTGDLGPTRGDWWGSLFLFQVEIPWATHV